MYKYFLSSLALTSAIFLGVGVNSSANALQVSVPSLDRILSMNKATNTGTCSESRHRQLQDKVESLCKNAGAKSCRADKNPGMKKPEALENAKKFEACAAARDVINKECYGGGDAGHIQQANEARTAAKTCREVQ
jgi:Novel toxin 16